ncbi:prostaglandin E2 receptor EP4 subtype-like [Eriocheir sinensis]|uniref:prostaglandin E2 receptor EP4 subtype-like n=1 Tax=Eriocheir sinensis TaxID=95602 RepID=UPI0021CA1D7A|nr:prostaglandin E2 receptor EP4 subtype-like [Eriocheir sinensis]
MSDIAALLAPPCDNDTPPILPPEDVCKGGDNCTLVASNPGATIISPLLLSLAGVTGHIGALCYLYSGPRRSNTHTVFYLLLCTLIWTDFFGKVSTTPPALISYAFGRWMGGREMCHLHGFTMILVQEVTFLTVAAMAVERLLAICHGYLYERLVTFSRCWYLLASIWVSSLLVCLLPLFGVGEFFLQYPFTWCFINIHLCPSTPLRHRLFTTTMGFFNAGCLVVIVVCNICVVGTLLRMRLSRRIPAHLSGGRRASVQRDQELQMVVLLLIITAAFVLSWGPLTLLQCCNHLKPPHVTREDHMQDLVAIRLVSISQILDPWVYIICRVLFKSKAWQCWRRVMMEGRRWSRRRHSHSLKNKHNHSDYMSPSSDANPPSPRASSPVPPPSLIPGGEDSTHLNGAPTWRPPQHLTTTTTTFNHNHHQPPPPDGFFGDSIGLVDIGGGDDGGGDSGIELPPLPPPPPPLPEHQMEAFQVVELPRGGGDEGGGGDESTPLTRSVSLAIPSFPSIPIPLFICEHYTMGPPAVPAPLTPASQQEGGVTRARSCCLDHHHHHHLPLPLPPIPGGLWGVPRSRSWGSSGGCGGGGGGGSRDRPPQRSSSTQTLPGGASFLSPAYPCTANKGEGTESGEDAMGER